MKIEDMSFDLDGKPLPDSPAEVRAKVMGALDDPHSELVAVILRQDGDLMVQIMDPPSRETLADLEQVLKTAIRSYRHVLQGQ